MLCLLVFSIHQSPAVCHTTQAIGEIKYLNFHSNIHTLHNASTVLVPVLFVDLPCIHQVITMGSLHLHCWCVFHGTAVGHYMHIYICDTYPIVRNHVVVCV